ncbi:MAG: nucleotidyltransferase domain-containing protein [Desulfotomaculum sp.]|nr:nucleotidyltransferase domain-containing protein [Desulfotomaculum sp.]MCL0081126.1 nucleotidyltransferase domain-containing protein [Peptococcaceae bacterium]
MNKQIILNNICKKYGIALVYIFGSQVKTGLDLLKGIKKTVNDPLTDIDVGVIFQFELPGYRQRYRLYSDLFNELEDLFTPYPLDLVFLQETHSVFQGHAICGQCIYYHDLLFKENYQERVLYRAADFRPFLEQYLDEVLEEA